MSENQYLGIIENKLDAVTELVEQQVKSGVFFDGFTKQVLEKIHNKLEVISNYETNELITYLTEELKRSLEERHSALQDRLDNVQGQINGVQANLNDSLKTPEIANIFTKLSDNLLDFSRDLSSQTRYFNTTIEDVKASIDGINIDEKISRQSENIKGEIDGYKANLDRLADNINSSFNSVQRMIENNAPSEALVALSGDISVVQKGLNDIISAVVTMNGKQGEIISSISAIAGGMDVQDIRLDVSAIVAEMQALKESVRVLVNKSDIEALNEKLNFAIETVSNLKELSAFNDSENKSIFNSYFVDLTNLVSTLVSKEEGELIKSRLEFIQSGIESGKTNFERLMEVNNNEVKNLIPLISSLSTKDNVKEISDNAILELTRLTNEWNERLVSSNSAVDEKLESFKMALSNIFEALGGINSKIDFGKGQNETAIKDEISSINDYISQMSEQVAGSTRNSVMEMSAKFGEISFLVNSKIDNLSGLINSSQNGLKDELTDNIAQLKDFSQNLVNVISEFEGKLSEKAEEIKLDANEKYNSLVSRVDNLTEIYTNSNAANKSEILAQIDSVKAIVQASRSIIESNNNYDVVNSKIESLETVIIQNKEEVSASNNTVVSAIDAHVGILEQINNSVKDLYIGIADGKSSGINNKAEIINVVTDKVSQVTTLIDEVKGQIAFDFIGSQENLTEKFEVLRSETEQFKTILNEVNENQASKQILAAILESVTGKLESVSNLITQNKDYTLEQYDGIKNLTNSLKNDISDVVVILNQSAEFAGNMLDRISAGFVDISENLTKQVAVLKNDIGNLNSEHKFEIVKQIEGLETQLCAVQDAIASFNFDESVKEQLLDLKHQIEAFNQQSLGDILSSIGASNEKTSEDIKETVSSVKTCFDEVLGRINLMHAQSDGFKNDIVRSVIENFESVSQKAELLTDNLEKAAYGNKEQIIGEINNLKASAGDLNAQIQSVGDNMLKDEFILAQTDKIQDVVRILAEDFGARLDDISNTDKGYVSDAVKSAVSDLQQEVTDSINYLKGLNLNLDRSLAAAKSDILEGIFSLKDTAAKNIDVTNAAKDAVIIEISQSLADKTIDIKSSIEAKIQENSDRFDEKIGVISSNIQQSGVKNKEQILAILEELKTAAVNINTGLIEALASHNSDIKSSFNIKAEENYTGLKDSLAIISQNLQSNSSGNKEQIIEAVRNIETEFNKVQVDFAAAADSRKEEILGAVRNAEEIYGRIQEDISISADNKKEEIKTSIEAKIEENTQIFADKLNLLSNTLQNAGYRNKQQIMDEISALKPANEELKTIVYDVQAELKQNAADNKSDIITKISELKTVISANEASISAVCQEKIAEIVSEISEKIDEATLQSEKTKNDVSESLKTIAVDNRAEIISQIVKHADILDGKLAETAEKIQSTALSNKSELISAISGFQSSSDEIKEELISISEKILSESDISEETDKIRASISTLSESISAKINELSASAGDKVVEEMQTFAASMKNELASALSTIKSLNNSFNAAAEETKTAVTSQLEEIRELVSENKENLANTASKLKLDFDLSLNSVSEKINGAIPSREELVEAFSAANEELDGKLDDNVHKIEALKTDIKQILGSSFANISDTIAQGKTSDDEFKETISYEFKKSIENITDKLFKADEENTSLKSELLFEIQKSYNVLTEKLDTQGEKTDSLKASVSEVVSDNLNVMDEKLQNKYNKLQASLIKDISEEINIEALKADICKDILENSANIAGKMDELAETLSSDNQAFETLAKTNKDAILAQITMLKNDISNIKVDIDILPEVKRIEEKFESVSDNILDALSNDLDASFTENIKIITEAVEDKISYIKDDIQEVVLKISEVDSVASTVKDIVTVQFEDYFDSFESKLTNFGDDLKKYMSKATDNLSETIEQYQKELSSLCDIDLEGYHEDTKKFVKEQIETLTEKLDDLKSDINNQGQIEEFSSEIKDTVISSSENINKRLEILRDIIIADMPNGDELNAQLEELQDVLAVVNKNAIDAKNESSSLKDVVSRYQKEINALSDIDLSSFQSETQDFIKSELKQVKEQFVLNLTSVFENISFIEESEEIQSAIYDNADDIKKEINNLKTALIDNSNSNDDIDDKFDNLKTILESITTGTSSKSGDYIYTLPDVETDIAKMRMAIGDITDMLKRSKEEGNDVAERLDSIDDIRDDISSISKRTNKLILTSDDSNKYLKENISEFKKVVNELNQKCNQIDSTQLNRNITDVKSLVMSSLKSDKILNEAFMHLAEWIDESAATMNSIGGITEKLDKTMDNIGGNVEELSSKVMELEKSNRLLSDMKETLSDLALRAEKKGDIDYSKSLYEMEYTLDKISDKMDVQELKIKSLEKKLDSIANSPASSNEEMTSILEFIASQVSAANENSRGNKLLMQKIDAMERQMDRFEKSISRITAFVDEDNQ